MVNPWISGCPSLFCRLPVKHVRSSVRSDGCPWHIRSKPWFLSKATQGDPFKAFSKLVFLLVTPMPFKQDVFLHWTCQPDHVLLIYVHPQTLHRYRFFWHEIFPPLFFVSSLTECRGFVFGVRFWTNFDKTSVSVAVWYEWYLPAMFFRLCCLFFLYCKLLPMTSK